MGSRPAPYGNVWFTKNFGNKLEVDPTFDWLLVAGAK
jgi:hypothetical protein